MRKPSPRCRFRPLALEPIEPRRLLAFAAELVADVNATPFSPETDPKNITDVNGVAFYTASTAGSGIELWRSDGTAAGTALVKDILPGAASADPRALTNVNGILSFSAASASGRELWRSDGTSAGTYRVKDIFPGVTSSDPNNLINVNGTLFFSATDETHGRELWKSDGTSDGTQLVRDIDDGSVDYAPHDLMAAGGLAFFLSGNYSSQLWRSDGTSAGTFQLTNVDTPRNLAEANGKLFFTANDPDAGYELWSSDGSEAGTQQVADILPGSESSYPRQLTDVSGSVFFVIDRDDSDYELWKSDGTAEGTVLLRAPSGNFNDFEPESLINANGTLFFTSQAFLWKSNGTAEGTVFIGNSTTNGDSYITSELTNVGGTVYFAASAVLQGNELWKSDGTRAGTGLLKDIYPGIDGNGDYYADDPYSSNPRFFARVGDKLFLNAEDTNGRHLWTSDGTPSGTTLVDSVDVRTHSGDVKPELDLNGRLIFTGVTDPYGVRAFVSDGTTAGTQQLGNKVRQARYFANINGIAYFAGSNYDLAHSGRELWKTDGTPTGTVLVRDINTEEGYSNYFPNFYYYGSNPSGFTGLNGKVLFVVNDRGNGGNSLWTSDGTSAGTASVRQFSSTALVKQLTRLGTHVLFSVVQNSKYELWRTDGTPNGTALVKQFNAGGISPDSTGFFVFREKLYFSADDGVHGRELWQSDGITAGTVMLKDLAEGATGSNPANLTEVRGTLYFTTSPDGGDKLLWKTDGPADGTVFVANIGTAAELTNGNGTLFFNSDVGGTGAELWKSNGSAAGTVRVKDLIPGPGGSHPRELQGANGVLFFEADLPNGGRGFWLSNGTREGTVPVLQDPTPLTGMRFLTNVNGQLFFAGTDLAHGEELWKLTTGNPVVQFSGTTTYKENAPLQLIAPFARISDADNVAFPGGTLSIVVDQNAGRSDHVEIRNQGNASGQIGVSGRTIRYGGVVIGSYRAGLPGAQLIIDLNANTSATITQALLRNIGYRNDSDNPSTKPRRVTVTLTDGSGGISSPISKTINVTAVNDAPRLVLGGQVSYTNNSAGVLLAPLATVSDADSANFFGALLAIEITSARGPSNRLQLGGGYSIDADRLLRNGVEVGTVLENGVGWNALQLRFNSQMTAARVQELLRSLRFRTVDNANLDPRTISFSLTDGDGGASLAQNKTVKITN
jgi:ELWxxDGT repeat protein